MSIELERMTPSRAAYFMERFKREEKLLGPNEQAALTYVIDMLEKATAIQQAESEPVAVRNPFASRCYTMSESHLSGHRLIVGFEKLEDAQSAHEWVARCGRSNPGELPGMWHESDLIGGETDCEPSRPPHPAPGVLDIEAAAKKLAECMDYPWEHMPEKGRANMRKHAASVLTAAQAQKGGECLPIRGNQVTCSRGTGGCGIQHKGGD